MFGIYVMKLVVLLLLMVGLVPAAMAQEAPSGSALTDLGLPELNISITDSAFEGVPDQVEAGRYLLTVTAAENLEFGGGVEFVQPPDGMTAEEFVAAMTGPPDTGAGGATPDAGAASPEGGEDMGAPPAFFFEAYFAGGVFAPSGATAEAVVDLGPGEWIASGNDPEAPQPPVIFEVTGELPADLPEPASNATLIMGEYVIEVSEGEMTAGANLLKIENIGAQPHFIVSGSTDVDVTEEDIGAFLESEMTGTPAAVDFDPDEDFQEGFYTATQSTGTTMWVSVDLKVGTHILLCFFPDISDGAPHAYHGMYAVIEVGE